jgi:hypothetical protein
MKATFDPTKKQTFCASARKENALYREYAALVPCSYRKEEPTAAVTLRLYWPGSVCYAALWVRFADDRPQASGTGSAGGGGYCKASASAGDAIRNAGFTLSSRIDGVGEDAIREAVLALAKAAGHKNAKIHIAHP